MTVELECLYPQFKPGYSYRKGCRCARCDGARRAQDRSYRHFRCSSCDRWVRAKIEHDVCRRCRELAAVHAAEPDEAKREWAANVWAAWTPHERAEVAGALESLLASVRGGGHGVFARGRYVDAAARGGKGSSMSSDGALAGPKRTLAERLEEKAGVRPAWEAGLRYLGTPSSRRAA